MAASNVRAGPAALPERGSPHARLPGPEPVRPEPPPTADRASWLVLALALAVVALLYALTYRGALSDADEVFLFGVTRSLVERGDFAIDDLRWLQDRVKGGQVGPDGRLYAKYGLGQSLATVPGYVIGRSLSPIGQRAEFAGLPMGPAGAVRGVLATSLVVALLVLLGVALAARALGAAWPDAAWLAAAVGLGTIVWPYAQMNLSELLTAAGLLAAVGAASAGARRGSVAAAALAGAGLAVAGLARPVGLVAAPLVLGYVAWRWPASGRVAGLLAAALPVAGAAGLTLWYNALRFGSPFEFGYAGEGFTNPILAGLLGFLVSPGKSLFLFNPVLLLAPLGLPRLLRRAPAETALLLALGGVYLALHAAWWAWEGGWSWGPRLALPIVPLAALLALPIVERWSPARRAFALAVAAVLPLLGAIGHPMGALQRTIVDLGLPERQYAWSLAPSYVAVQWQQLLTGGSDALALRGLAGAAALAVVFAALAVGLGGLALATRARPAGGWRLGLAAAGAWGLALVLTGLVLALPREAERVSERSPEARVARTIVERGPEGAGVVYSSTAVFYAAYPLLSDRPHLVVPDDWPRRTDALHERLLDFAGRGGQTWLVLDYARPEPDRVALAEGALDAAGLRVFDAWFDTLRLVAFVGRDGLGDQARLVPSDARFGDALVLDGRSALPERIVPPATLRIVTRWRLGPQPEPGLKLFVHLAGPDGRPLRQADLELPPAEPSDHELLGVADVFVDGAVPAGQYRVLLGVYRSPDGPRLAVAPGPADYLELGRVEVAPPAAGGRRSSP